MRQVEPAISTAATADTLDAMRASSLTSNVRPSRNPHHAEMRTTARRGTAAVSIQSGLRSHYRLRQDVVQARPTPALATPTLQMANRLLLKRRRARQLNLRRQLPWALTQSKQSCYQSQPGRLALRMGPAMATSAQQHEGPRRHTLAGTHVVMERTFADTTVASNCKHAAGLDTVCLLLIEVTSRAKMPPAC